MRIFYVRKKVKGILAVIVLMGIGLGARWMIYDDSAVQESSLSEEEAEKKKKIKCSLQYRESSRNQGSLGRLKQEQTYTQDNMLIKYNPFGTNTQSLYVYFETENPAQISYTIHVADSSIEDFKRTCYQESEMQTQHELQVIGLTPDLENEITFTIAYEDGTVEEKTVSYDLLRNSLKAVGVVEKNILLFYNGGKCKGGEENDTVEQHQ